VDKRLSAGIAIVITLAWTTSFLVGVFNTHYIAPPSIQALMLIVAGAAFSNAVFPRRNDDNGNSKNGG
jgi:hypothetical protein